MYSSRLVSQLTNKVMLDGKKGTAEKIVYDALAIAAERSGKQPVEVLEAAVKSVTPVLETRSRRVGAPTTRCPSRSGAPRPHARDPLARDVLARPAREGHGREARRRAPRCDRAAGRAFKRKDDLYRMAQANKAFAHYRW